MTNKKSKPKAKAPARAVREFTAGGVVFRRTPEGKIQIVMIQDPKERWTIPKGHVEPGEQLEQTALREVSEETGLKYLKIRDKLDKMYFFYRKEGKLIFMTTYIFLMEATARTDDLVPEEWMHGLKWFEPEDAMKQVEYRETEKLFRLGLSKIESGQFGRPTKDSKPQDNSNKGLVESN